MADTLFRDEILNSEPWLDLPTDTDRLAFFGLRLRADDFGNIEGGLRRLFRFLQGFTQIKTQEAAATALSHLVDADMIRAYSAHGRDFYHLPKTRTPKTYLVRKCPPSPWCDAAKQLGKHVRKVSNQGLAKNVPVTLHERNEDVLLGVGVGVGVGVGDSIRNVVQNPPREAVAKSQGNNVPLKKGKAKVNNETRGRWDHDEKTVDAKGRELGLAPKPGESYPDYTRRLWTAVNAHSRGST